MLSALECRKAADACDRDAARVSEAEQARQFRLLAKAWRELADEIERKTPEEARTFATLED